MDIEITHLDSIIIGRDFLVSFLIQNNGWEDKEQVTFMFNPNNAIVPVGKTKIKVDKITAGGSYGERANFRILPNASAGTSFLNLDYSQILLENNEMPRKADHTNIAIILEIKEQAKVNIHSITPESIFAQAEFPFVVEILSEDMDLKDIVIKLVPPNDIEFGGETLHTFSSIKKGKMLSITSRVITPPDQVHTEHKITFQILVSYTDDTGEQKIDSETVSLMLRPRTFMEITTDGGIWIGNFFIAPYVSLGTIIGIPAGILFSLIIKRKTKR